MSRWEPKRPLPRIEWQEINMNSHISSPWKWFLASAPILAYGFWVGMVVVPRVVQAVVPQVIRVVLK